jgi:glycine cleavage system aminomethyltransferase T
VVPARKPARPWWHLALPAGLAIAAAAILLLVIRPRTETERANEVRVKGVGVVVIDIVRERGGVIRDDVTTFREGDRFKIVVTCPPEGKAHFALRVREAGTQQIDRPLAPADLACGNRVVMPGAFTLTGTKANELCVDVTGPDETKTACVTLRPE